MRAGQSSKACSVLLGHGWGPKFVWQCIVTLRMHSVQTPSTRFPIIVLPGLAASSCWSRFSSSSGCSTTSRADPLPVLQQLHAAEKKNSGAGADHSTSTGESLLDPVGQEEAAVVVEREKPCWAGLADMPGLLHDRLLRHRRSHREGDSSESLTFGAPAQNLR